MHQKLKTLSGHRALLYRMSESRAEGRWAPGDRPSLHLEVTHRVGGGKLCSAQAQGRLFQRRSQGPLHRGFDEVLVLDFLQPDLHGLGEAATFSCGPRSAKPYLAIGKQRS